MMSTLQFVNMEWISAIGTAAFALSGYLVGVKKRFDLLGIFILAFLTSAGGGIMRDMMLARIPLVLRNSDAILIVVSTLVIAWLARVHRHNSLTFSRLFIIADSLGLVAFSIMGAQFGLLFDLSSFGVILLGFVTAVGGGIVRDMVVNEVPFILHRDFYGTVAILVAGVLFVMNKFNVVNGVTLYFLFFGGVAVRLFAHWREFVLPKIDKASSKEKPRFLS